MSFVNALAHIANIEDHHPDLEVGYNYCRVRYSTHAIGGLSENDLICAAKIDRIPGQACSRAAASASSRISTRRLARAQARQLPGDAQRLARERALERAAAIDHAQAAIDAARPRDRARRRSRSWNALIAASISRLCVRRCCS